jgi:hypothetical protein
VGGLLVFVLFLLGLLGWLLDKIEERMDEGLWRAVDRAYRELFVLGMMSAALWVTLLFIGEVEAEFFKVSQISRRRAVHGLLI